MRRKTFKPQALEIDYSMLAPIENGETIILTDEILKEYKLQVDSSKIEHFEDINFISIFD